MILCHPQVRRAEVDGKFAQIHHYVRTAIHEGGSRVPHQAVLPNPDPQTHGSLELGRGSPSAGVLDEEEVPVKPTGFGIGLETAIRPLLLL